jgi:hypothetical protein
MALDFPSDGSDYTDDCGNVWKYNETDNSWSIAAPIVEVDPDSIWKRTNGVIEPQHANDTLDMGNTSGDIDLQNFPLKN